MSGAKIGLANFPFCPDFCYNPILEVGGALALPAKSVPIPAKMKKKTKTSVKPRTVRATRGDGELMREIRELTRDVKELTAAVKADRRAVKADPYDLDRRLAKLVKDSEKSALRAEADRDRQAEIARAAEADRDRQAEIARAAEADRDRLERLENEAKESKGHRRNLSRALENSFANSLPRAMKAHNISIQRRNIRMRARRSNNSREFDFIARNGKLALAGEVKTHLTSEDVRIFFDAINNDFRELFPEYAGLPVYGVVCGGAIDDDAARAAYKRGFIILQMEGAELHPATGKKFNPKAY